MTSGIRASKDGWGTIEGMDGPVGNEFEVQRNLMEASDKYAGERIDALKTDLQTLMAEYQDAV